MILNKKFILLFLVICIFGGISLSSINNVNGYKHGDLNVSVSQGTGATIVVNYNFNFHVNFAPDPDIYIYFVVEDESNNTIVSDVEGPISYQNISRVTQYSSGEHTINTNLTYNVLYKIHLEVWMYNGNPITDPNKLKKFRDSRELTNFDDKYTDVIEPNITLISAPAPDYNAILINVSNKVNPGDLLTGIVNLTNHGVASPNTPITITLLKDGEPYKYSIENTVGDGSFDLSSLNWIFDTEGNYKLIIGCDGKNLTDTNINVSENNSENNSANGLNLANTTIPILFLLLVLVAGLIISRRK